MLYKNDFRPHPYQNVQPCLPTPPLDYLDQWIPLTSLETMANADFDVIIVGSGAGGGAVLWRLCDKWRKNGKRIAVLERGDLLLPTHAINLPTFNQERLMRFIENPRYKHRVTGRDSGSSMPLDFTQFFALGGKTLHWGTGSPRFHPADFIHWPITYQDLSPYYKVAERVMGVSRNFTKGSYIQHMLIKRLQAIGYTDAVDFPLAIDFNIRKNGLHLNGVFSSIHFLAYSLNVGSFDLAVNARVVQVLTEKGSVAGVKVLTPDQKTYVIKGKTVVLAASTVENPRILLCSNIQGEAIGKYLVIHSLVGVNGTLKLRNSLHDEDNLAILIPRTKRRLYQIQIHRHQKFEYSWDCYGDTESSGRPDNLKIYLQGFGSVEPRFANCVALDPKEVDDYGIPKLNIEFAFGQRDWDVVHQMISTIYHQAGGIGVSLHQPPCLKAPGNDFHESGTCRMGHDPYTSVTNQFGELHHVSNLFVADSSVLPYIGGTNPMLTVVALGIRTADYILARSS